MEVFVQLKPGASLLIKSLTEKALDKPFLYADKKGPAVNLTGRWVVRFINGGPVLPETVETPVLESWTNWSDPDLKRFSGLAEYSIHFRKPKTKAEFYQLDLGAVKESADVLLNGTHLATLIGDDFTTIVDASLLIKDNLLEIRIANGMANHIIYMDQQGIPYKKFYNVNFPAFDRKNRGPDGLFSAEKWQPLPSGLLGPVTLTPLTKCP